jgi:hypothetical protein
MALRKDMTVQEVDALRSVEREIDNAYAGNPLVKENLGTAVWSLLSFVEDREFLPMLRGRVQPAASWAIAADETLNALKFPLAWLHRACVPGRSFSRAYDSERYQAGWDILELARRYYGFSGPFQYWDQGEWGLRLEETTVIAETDCREVAEYEAYNRLIDSGQDQESANEANVLAQEIESAVRVNGARFTVSLNPRLAGKVLAYVEPLVRRRFTLPDAWSFSRYSVGEFRLVHTAMFALALIQQVARRTPAVLQSPGLGLEASVIVLKKIDLVARVARYTGLPAATVTAVLDDLTYGSRQKNPDPALQPFIRLAQDDYAVSPFLWTITESRII